MTIVRLARPWVQGAAIAVSVLLGSCKHGDSARPDCDFVPAESRPSATLKVAQRFSTDAAFRRQCLEGSLVNRENGYSKTRLKHYTPGAWKSLPLANFPSRPIRPSDLGKPVPSPDAEWRSVAGGASPTDLGDLADLEHRGEAMFTRFPAQIEASLIPLLRDEQGPARYGLWRTGESIGGLVWVALPGGVYPAMTCSSCHASVDASGRFRPGIPNHAIDLGKAKDDFANMRSLYSTWGPGRVDIAADGRDNPIVIADVRTTRYEQYLHRTANVKNSLVALALRVETGLVTAHYNAVRPEPADAFALAYYLWSLGRNFELDRALQHPARGVFERHCGSCHGGRSHTGKPVTPESIQSPVADMPSPARGTGTLNSTSLVGVKDRRLLLFGGQARGIADLLDPNRSLGGHYVGQKLTDDERRAMQAYLEQL